jgi:cob(I)alamin adenosyltransferase
MATEGHQVAPELKPIQDKLENVIRQLKELKQNPSKVTTDQLTPIQETLRSVDEQYSEERAGFVLPDGRVPEGQANLSELLNEAHQLLEEVQNSMPDDE